FFFSSRRRHTRFSRDWSSDVCSSDLLDAVRLFQSVARRAQLSFTVGDTNRDEVLEICRLVHGLPLGIELAAAWAGRLSLDALVRSEERRVGKECRARGAACRWTRK